MSSPQHWGKTCKRCGNNKRYDSNERCVHCTQVWSVKHHKELTGKQRQTQRIVQMVRAQKRRMESW